MAVKENQYVAWVFDPEPTSHLYPRNALTQGRQEVLFKYFLCCLFLRLLGCINSWVVIVEVFQINCDIPQELVVLREHRNDGNFESDALQTATSFHDDSPFRSEYW